MFEDVDALAERLLAADPAQDDPYWPTLDPDHTLLDELVLVQRLTSAAAAREMVILSRLCQRAESWGDRHARPMSTTRPARRSWSRPRPVRRCTSPR